MLAEEASHTPLRDISDDGSKTLGPGAAHYRAFVGPPDEYDLMGATQFRLLTTLGLREHHKLLDFGCGSLRAGRLFIPYLEAGKYHGLEPNTWLVEDAIERQLGADLVRIKRPAFFHNSDFIVDSCGSNFDFILAQSIFSHTGRDLMGLALQGFGKILAPEGIALFTVLMPGQDFAPEYHGDGWVYPDCVAHSRETVSALLEAAGLCGRQLPWHHPRQTWYAASRSPDALPPARFDVHMRGYSVLNAPET